VSGMNVICIYFYPKEVAFVIGTLVEVRSLLLPPTLIPLSGVGTTCFSSCCDKDSAFILRPAACLTSNWSRC
jgi:hypothetical protein